MLVTLTLPKLRLGPALGRPCPRHGL